MDYIFDIDGTVADASDRLHHITGPGPKDWDAFFNPAALWADKPIFETWAIIGSLIASGNTIIFATSRSEDLRESTEDWLTKTDCPIRANAANHFGGIGENKLRLYMRKSGDRRPSHVVKSEILDAVREDGFNPRFAFDDRKSDARMFRDAGLVCALLTDGEF
jgi:hypothetical protein